MTLVDLVQLVSFSIVWFIAAGLFGMLFGLTLQLKMMNPDLSLGECIKIALSRMYDFFGR